MLDSEPYNDILFDKNTDALCALIMYHIKIGGELITDDRATLLASDFNFYNIYFLFISDLILFKFLRK